MNNECEWCGNELLNTKSPRRKFCDDVCRARYRRANADNTGSYKVTCVCCGNSFRTYHDTKKYCSEECRLTGSSTHLTKRTKVIHKLKCDECSNTFSSTNKEQRFCSYKCKTRNRNKLNELERRKYYAEGDKTITLSKLIDKENNICYICLEECDSKDYIEDDIGAIICGNNYPSVEHVIPLSKGGKHEWENIKLAHRGCNIKKSNKLQKNLA